MYEAKVKMKKLILIILTIIVLAIIIGWAYHFTPKDRKILMTIRGDSMEPTLKDGQEVLLNIDYYKRNPIKRGDIIAFKFRTIKQPMVKRVIALPKDKVEFKKDGIYVNDRKIKEDYLKDPNYQFTALELKTILIPLQANNNLVPDNSYLCLSDNRIRKNDSRQWGFLPKDYVIGKVEYQ